MTSTVKNSHNRYDGLDILKALCAFFVVHIHFPFPGAFGSYFQVLCRIAVPCFFMITGFFSASATETTIRNKTLYQIRNMLFLFLFANLLCILFYIWYWQNGNIVASMLTLFSSTALKNFILFNETSSAAYHLWYLAALIYTLVIVYFAKRLRIFNFLLIITPILLLGSLLLGKYSVFIFSKVFPPMYGRNAYFIGIPFFCIGHFLSQNISYIKKHITLTILKVSIFIFFITSLIEEYLFSHYVPGAGLNGDIYISTPCLAISLFLFSILVNVNYNYCTNILTSIGKHYSTWIYILHIMIKPCLSFLAREFGFYKLYHIISPVLTYVAAVFLIYMVRFLYHKLTDIFSHCKSIKHL